MPISTETEIFPKASYDLADVERERQLRLDAGATSSTIITHDDEFVLVTIWPDVQASADSG